MHEREYRTLPFSERCLDVDSRPPSKEATMPWASQCKTCENWFLAVAEPDDSLEPSPAIPAPNCPYCHQRVEMDVPAGCRGDTLRLFPSEPCPVCALPAERKEADATVQGYRVVCPLPQACGEFLISIIAIAELTRFTPEQRKTLSRALQTAADDGEPLTLRSREDIEAALGSAES